MNNIKNLRKKIWYLGYDKRTIERYRPKMDADNIATVKVVSLVLVVIVAVITSFYVMFDNQPRRNIICIAAAVILLVVYANSRKMERDMSRYSSAYVDRFIDLFSGVCFAVAIYLGTFAAGDEMAVAPVWMFFFAVLIFNRMPAQNLAVILCALAVFFLCSYLTKSPRNFQYDTMHVVTSVIGVLCMSWEKSRMKMENVRALDRLESANLEIMETVEEQEREAQLLRHKASRDELTGLLKKDVFEEQVKEILEASEDGSLHAMVCVDIDNFKDVNDGFGHLYGDQVLKDVSDLIREELGAGNFSGRFGGDEFCLFFPNLSSRKEAESHIRQLLERIRSHFSQDDKKCPVSVSAGIAFYPESGLLYHKLFMSADQALYQCKKDGKNGYSIH